MPRVPVFDQYQVDPNAAPGERYVPAAFSGAPGMPNPGNLPVSGGFGQPAGFSGGTVQPVAMPNVPGMSPELASIGSRQLQNLGQAAEGLGDRMSLIAVDAQNRANALRVDDALNKAMEAAQKLQFDKDGGFMNLRGKDAVGATEKYGADYRKQIEDIGSGLGNDAQKELFGARANNLLTQFSGAATQHEAKQFQEYALSVREGTVANAMNEIGLKYYDQGAINQAVASIQSSVYEQGKLLGKSGEWVEAQTRKMTSNAHKVALSAAIANDNIGYAQAYLKKWGPSMDADDTLHVQGLITRDSESKVAMGAAGNAVQGLAPRMITSSLDRLYNITTRIDPNAGQGPAMGVTPIVGDFSTSSKFGARKDPINGQERLHEGTDFAAPIGTQIVASAGGKVVRAEVNQNGYGKMVEIDHGNGYSTIYAHASDVNVTIGQEVGAGDPIAKVGNTGRSTGAHLHFEVRKDGKSVDPSEFLSTGGTGRQQMAEYLKTFNSDTGMAIAAKITSPVAVNDAVRQATETGAPGNWLKFMPEDVQAKVDQGSQAYKAGLGQYQQPSLYDVHSTIRESLGPNAPARVLRAALDEGTRQYEDLQKAITQQKNGSLAQAQRILFATKGNWGSLSPDLLGQIDPGHYDDLQGYAGKMAAGVPIETNLPEYNKLVANPAKLAGMSEDEFNNLQLKTIGRGDFKTLSGIRAKAMGTTSGGTGGPGDLNIEAINNVLNQRLRTLNIDPTPKDDGGDAAARVGAVRKFVVDYVANAQAEAAKKFSDVEITQHVDKLFANTDVIHNAFFRSDSSGPAITMKVDDLDSKTKASIKEAFAKQGIAKPTDAQILGAYFSFKVYGK